MIKRKSRKILSVFLTVALLAALLPTMAVPARADDEASGSWADYTTAVLPDDDDVYTVTTAEELAWVAKQVNSYTKFFSGCTVELGDDIDLSAHYWVPIGANAEFQGNFDGNGCTISGLTILSTDLKYAGLFGRATAGTIEDLELEDVSIESTYNDQNGYAGGLAGYSSGLLKNCSVAGDVSLSSDDYYAYCGGLAGLVAEGSIENCSVSGSVTATMNQTETYCGGLVGQIYSGSISDCVSSADVGTSADYLGGLVGNLNYTPAAYSSSTGAVDNGFSALPPFTGGFVGYASGTSDMLIEECYASGDVTQGTNGGDAGGFAGLCSGYTVSGCYATGNVSGGNQTGGFVGYNYAAITDSYATGSAIISGTDLNTVCGGFVGYNSRPITKCYATGDAEGGQVGGFAGWVTSDGGISSSSAAGNVIGDYSAGGFACNVSASVSDCYATGDATGGTYAGGFVGNNWSSGTETNCYSVGDVDVTGSSNPGGFAGVNKGSDANCYWLSGTAPGAVGFVDSDSVPTAAEERTGDELSASDFYETLNDGRTPAPWTIIADRNSGYPVLIGVGDGAGTKYTVTFADGDDTTKIYRTKKVVEGSTLLKPADPTKDGFTFEGWYDEPSGGDAWDFETDAVEDDLTLYAHWTAKTYGVSGTVSSGFDAISVEGLTVGLYASDATEYSSEALLYSATTDEYGYYSIPAVANGNYVAVVAADAGGVYAESKSAPFAAGDGVDVTANIALTVLCTIGGTVTLPDGENPASGATVKLYNVIGFFEEFNYLDTATADGDGNYEFSVSITEPSAYAVIAEPRKQGGELYGGGSNLVSIADLEDGTAFDADISLADLDDDSWLAYAEEPDDYDPESDEIYIDTPEELAWLSLQSIMSFDGFEDVTVYLEDDLDLQEHNWWPICSSMVPFAGEFYGDGHVISNLTVDAFYDTSDDSTDSLMRAGLFGGIEEGWVEDLGLEDVSVTIDSDVEGTVEFCAGALVGYADEAEIYGCYSTGAISSSVSGSVVGGLIGHADASEITKCYSECDISGTYDHDGSSPHEGFGGGLLGRLTDYSEVYDCYATGDVSGECDYNGGLVGCYAGGDWVDLVNCYAIGDVSGAIYNGSFAGYGDYGYDSYTENIHWLEHEGLLGIADGNADSLALNDQSGCSMSSGDMTTQDFADLLNSGYDEDDWDPWRWYEDINDGYPVLDGVGAGDIETVSVISLDEIGGVTPPVKGEVPVTEITETDEYTGTVSWSPADSPFGASTVYTATITLTPEEGYTLEGISADFFTVAGATSVSNAADSGIVTAKFPATGAELDTVIDIAAIPGVTAPARGATPVTTITATDQYTGTVTWSPDDSAFEASTVYTATITLTPKAGFTLTGVSEDFFTVSGATSVSNDADSGIVTAEFPATGAAELDTVIDIAEIPGVTPPVRGAVPVTEITETEEYTGTVSWSPDDSPFKASTVYTATIVLIPKEGYTIDGVDEDFFTVSGATSTANAADSGVITAIFPKTKAKSSGSSNGSGTRSNPTYYADVRGESGSKTTLPVTVDQDTGTASADASALGSAQAGTIITVPAVPGVDTYCVGIPVQSLSTSDTQGVLILDTAVASVAIPLNMLTDAQGISGSTAQISIGQGDKDNLPEDVKAAIGDRPLVQLTLLIDGKQTDWSNPNAAVTVSIPYTPTAAELANPESIVVWYIDGSGNLVAIPNGHYDPVTGTVTFQTTHFSLYAVGYNAVGFIDVAATSWYAKAVSFIAARQITSGTGDGSTFRPEAKLTRGEFIVLIMRACGISPDTNPTDNFSDAGNTYYTGYLAAAKRLGISAGTGNNMYAPDKEITRQEMFTLLYNVLKAIGQLPQGGSGKALDHFTDAEQIDTWAKDAMSLLVETGIAGGSNGALNPLRTTTRAEMAQVLYNLLGK